MPFNHLLHLLNFDYDALREIGVDGRVLNCLLGQVVVPFIEVEEISDCDNAVEVDIKGLIDIAFLDFFNNLLMDFFYYLFAHLCLLLSCMLRLFLQLFDSLL